MELSSNLIEAANRAEATALLIRKGYRVYRPEADVSGEDLILRTPENKLIVVQMKSRPTVDRAKYEGIWMLFPDPRGRKPGRDWFLIEHDILFKWWEVKHGNTKSFETGWSTKTIAADLMRFLHDQHATLHPNASEEDTI